MSTDLERNKLEVVVDEFVEEIVIDKVQSLSPWKMVIRRLRKNKLAMVGLGILIFMILFSFLGP